jgi:hypothetical protein
MISNLKRTFRFYRFCPACDHGIRKRQPGETTVVCPRCGTPIEEQQDYQKTDWNRVWIIALSTLLAGLLMLSGAVTYLYFANRTFAQELRSLRQPRPNHFYFGIDVSQTIRPDILSDFTTCVARRLQQFIGDGMVRYAVSQFGLPGCGTRSIQTVLDRSSPSDPTVFDTEITAALHSIKIAFRGSRQKHLPLTTPLYAFLEQRLVDLPGKRILILSDLVNDEGGCREKRPFPLEALRRFGENPQGQLIFFYPPPYLPGNYYSEKRMAQLLAEQQKFISETRKNGEKRRTACLFLPGSGGPPENPCLFHPAPANNRTGHHHRGVSGQNKENLAKPGVCRQGMNRRNSSKSVEFPRLLMFLLHLETLRFCHLQSSFTLRHRFR